MSEPQALDEALLRFLLDRARSERPFDEHHGGARYFEPLAATQLDSAERQLGLSLPASVRDLYGFVGNGGYGPGYGLIGLVGGCLSDLGTDVAQDYLLRRQSDPNDPGWFWPEGVLAICHWGCAIYSCIDCTKPSAPVLRFDPNPVDADWSVAWSPESFDLAGWLNAWLQGDELFVSGTPAARQPDA